MRRDMGLVLGAGLKRAAADSFSLTMTAATLGSAIFLQSWPLAGLAAIGYAVSVTLDMARGSFWTSVLKEIRRQPPPLPSEEGLVDPTARKLLVRIESARDDRLHAMELSGPELCERLSPVLEAAADLEARAAVLLPALDELGRYLAGKSLGTVLADIERLRAAAARADDPQLRARYQRACRAAEERLAALRELVVERDLASAELEALTAVLEAVPCRLMRFRGLAAQGAPAGSEETDVAGLMADLRLLENAVAQPDS